MRNHKWVLFALSAWLIACAPSDRTSRVLVLGLDGLDPTVIDLLMSEGSLPNFAKLRRDGAYAPLISQEPLLSPIIWTTIATGREPGDHGIGHFVAVSSETGDDLPVTSQMRQVKAIWNIASDAGREVATVGWWATWPPEEINGVVVSDHTSYHFLFEGGFTGDSDGATTYPPDLAQQLEPMVRRPQDLGIEDLRPFVEVSERDLERDFDFEDELGHFRWALATAMSYRDIGLDLWRTEQPELEMVYIEGVDSTSHLFGHLFRAEGLVGELAEQQHTFGSAVESMYHFADRLLGEFMEAMDERTTLVVLSDHGFELGKLHDDPSRTRDLRRVSERFHRLEGILYLYGHQVKRHGRFDQPRIQDIAPTLLTLMGLPAGRDMPGRVLMEGLDPGAQAKEAASRRVPSYESGAATGDQVPREAAVDDAILEHLRSLGYLGTSSPQGDRNLAAIAFEAGRYDEAAERYAQLVAQDPEDASLRTSFAGTLGALGRFDEAAVELRRALEINPLNIEAYHNLGVIAERRSQPEEAIALYQEALRYQPQYEPSIQALRRLTGSAMGQRPLSQAEATAAQLANEASLAARRGDYERAMELLDEAARVAPEFALIQQYRSNVAYLMGDVALAIAALERGLELEPDNKLFAENLRRLVDESSQR